MRIEVPVTGTNYRLATYEGWCQDFRKGCNSELTLERRPNNEHDKYAVAVMYQNEQLGWVGRTHSKQVAKAMDDGLTFTVKVHSHEPFAFHMERLKVLLEAKEGSLWAIRTCNISRSGSPAGTLAVWQVNHVYTLRSNPNRSSVTVVDKGKDHAWFDKAYVSSSLIGAIYDCEIVAVQEGALLKLYKEGNEPKPKSTREAVALTGARNATNGVVQGSNASILYKKETADDNYFSTHLDQPTTPKENKMNFSNATTKFFDTNKSAATQAGYLEAGRIANNQFVKVAGKALPMMVRGYADTPVGKLLIANIAQMAAAQLRPNEPTLAKLTNAMTVAAYQEVIQTVDIEGWLNELLESPELKRAIAKLPKDETDYANSTQANREHLEKSMAQAKSVAQARGAQIDE